VLKDPLVGGDIGPRGPGTKSHVAGDQIPCVVGQQGLVLLHSTMPVGVPERATGRGQDWRQHRGSSGGGDL
jgi:hypothetical protein